MRSSSDPIISQSHQGSYACVLSFCVCVAGWTTADPPESFSSWYLESCSTHTMGCLNIQLMTRTPSRSAPCLPSWTTTTNGEVSVSLWSLPACLFVCCCVCSCAKCKVLILSVLNADPKMEAICGELCGNLDQQSVTSQFFCSVAVDGWMDGWRSE